jgi:hypothetical protein
MIITNLLKNKPSLTIKPTLAEHICIMPNIIILNRNKHKLIRYITDELTQFKC